MAELTPELQTQLLDLPVSEIQYASGARLAALHKLGVQTVRDLLCYYPYRYNDFNSILPIATAPLGSKCTITGTVFDVQSKQVRHKLTVIEVSVRDDTGLAIITWFNQPWLTKSLVKGTKVVLIGKMEHSFGFRRMAAPLLEILESGAEAGGIQPVYRRSGSLTTGWIKRIVMAAFSRVCEPLDPLPATLLEKYRLYSRKEALRAIHNPESQRDLHQAKRRLGYEEALDVQLVLQQQRLAVDARACGFAHTLSTDLVRGLRRELPFDLTADQLAAIDTITADMAAPRQMRRLLLGDVGSGKTLVAAHALLGAAASHTQGVLMAPTEILAQQHAKTLGSLFDTLGISWALLTSSSGQEQRNAIYNGCATGTLTVVIGTHALIQDKLKFAQLSIAVIDEQHRFGVAAREALAAKGDGVDLLSMSATPIPRSLALILYGDMDISFIRTRPNAKTKTTTSVLPRSREGEAYDVLREAFARGEQAYIICPLIEQRQAAREQDSTQDDDMELLTEFSLEIDGTDGLLRAATTEVEVLRNKVFLDQKIDLLTSRLADGDKRAVMQSFAEGQTDLLVATTVVEVGVDVPNATCMIIEDAERFGLSQLHQLRGRVGRGQCDGQVFLIHGRADEDALERLAVMNRTDDGFELANYDLKMRREGDILGMRQSGAAALKLINVIDNAAMIDCAYEDAKAILEADPQLTLPEHKLLAHELQVLYPASEDR